MPKNLDSLYFQFIIILLIFKKINHEYQKVNLSDKFSIKSQLIFYKQISSQLYITSVKSTLKKHQQMKGFLSVFCRYNSASIKTPASSFQLNTLLNRLKVNHSPKLQYLNSLSSQQDFRKHFDQRTVKQLSVQDIVIYLHHRNKFTNAPYIVRREIIKNDNLDTYFKFLISKQLQMIEDKNHQVYLVKLLNQSLYKLNQQQFLYCMEKIFSFAQNAQNQLHLAPIQKKINALQDENYIQGVYYLHKINNKIQFEKSKLISYISNVSKTSAKIVFMLKKILQVQPIQTLTEAQQKKIQNLASKCIRNCKNQEISYAIGLLQFFPSFRHFVSLEKISSKDYLLYLRTQPSSLKFHSLPRSILSDATAYIFKDIIKERIKLQFESPREIIVYFKNRLTANMQEALGFIKYLSQQQIEDYVVWANLENVIIEQFRLSLNIKQKQLLNVLSKHELISVLKILGAMSLSKQSSLTFWKYTYSFVYTVLKDQQVLKLTNQGDQKHLIIYLHQIFTHKQPKQQIQQTLIQLTLLTLTRNKWKIKQLLPLTISLRVSKTGDNQLWFGIQKKLMSISIDAIHDFKTKKKLLWILNNFIAMNRGSYNFWKHFSKHLTKQEKQSLFQFIDNKSTVKKQLQN